MPKEKGDEKNFSEKILPAQAERFSVADNSDLNSHSSIQKKQQKAEKQEQELKEKQHKVAQESKRYNKQDFNNSFEQFHNSHNNCCIEKPKKSRLWYFLFVAIAFIGLFFFLIILFFIIAIFSMSSSDGIENIAGNVAVIQLKGVIVGDAEESFFDSTGLVSSTELIKEIEKAEKDESIKAIIFEINSPGGSGVASDEIAEKIKSVNKTTVAWVRELGASGAYWAASATDYIVAHKMSFVGSIGVIGSYLEFSGLMEKYGVGYERLVAGKYKDMGIPFRKLTENEKEIFQSELDAIHNYFIEEIANNRKLDSIRVKELATGQVYIGNEAKKLGLVDELGGKQHAVQYIEKQLNITASLVEYKKPKGLLDFFKTSSDRTAFFVGKGIGNSIITTRVSSQMDITT